MKFSLVLLLVLSMGRWMWMRAGAADEECAAMTAMAQADMVLAVTEGNLEAVERYLRAGGAAMVDDAGMSLIGLAAWHGQDHLVRRMIEHGVDVNAAAPAGWTPLMMAALGGQMESVEMLLRAGADVDARTDVGTTAISVAIDRGHEDIAERLFDAGRRSERDFERGAVTWLR